MEILDDIFYLILMVLERFIANSYVGGFFWMFILVATILIFVSVIGGVKSWSR